MELIDTSIVRFKCVDERGGTMNWSKKTILFIFVPILIGFWVALIYFMSKYNGVSVVVPSEMMSSNPIEPMNQRELIQFWIKKAFIAGFWGLGISLIGVASIYYSYKKRILKEVGL